MDFKLSAEEEKRRKEFFEGCKELSKEKPKDFIDGIEAEYEKANQPYITRCRKEFAKRGWLVIATFLMSLRAEGVAIPGKQNSKIKM